MIRFFNGLTAVLRNEYPTHPIYIQKLPEDYQRPAFSVELISGSTEELTRDTIRQDVVFEIKYYGELDSNGVVDRVRQMEEVANLQKLFFVGYLDLDANRKAKIAKVSVKPVNEDISISLEMNRTDDRRTPDVYEVMNQVDVVMNYNQ